MVDSGVKLGRRTRIWAFAHIVTGAIIGDDCNICDHTFVEGKVCIGNRVTIKCGVYVWDGIKKLKMMCLSVLGSGIHK